MTLFTRRTAISTGHRPIKSVLFLSFYLSTGQRPIRLAFGKRDSVHTGYYYFSWKCAYQVSSQTIEQRTLFTLLILSFGLSTGQRSTTLASGKRWPVFTLLFLSFCLLAKDLSGWHEGKETLFTWSPTISASIKCQGGQSDKGLCSHYSFFLSFCLLAKGLSIGH